MAAFADSERRRLRDPGEGKILGCFRLAMRRDFDWPWRGITRPTTAEVQPLSLLRQLSPMHPPDGQLGHSHSGAVSHFGLHFPSSSFRKSRLNLA